MLAALCPVQLLRPRTGHLPWAQVPLDPERRRRLRPADRALCGHAINHDNRKLGTYQLVAEAAPFYLAREHLEELAFLVLG